MRKTYNSFKKTFLAICLLLVAFAMSGCFNNKYYKYYSDRDNYFCATAIVTHISYDSEDEYLYIETEEMVPDIFDPCFEIGADNYHLVIERGVEKKLSIGDSIEFVTAPRYFWDAYMRPIVALTVDGEVLLEFEEGYANLLEYYK